MRNSGADDANGNLLDWTDAYRDKDNLQFLGDALAKLGAQDAGRMVIGLVGSRDIPGVTLRRAQSVLRWDLSPSHWSHAFLIAQPVGKGKLGKTRLLEVTLHDRAGHFPEPSFNGVNWATLGDYAEATLDANLALISLEMDAKEVKEVATRATDFNFDRVRHNFWDSLSVWQTYLWSNGQRPNPLREGFPIFSSQYVEMAFEAIGVDITPGASERNSAPEHLWNAAKWWHKAFKELYKKSISGVYVIRDEGCSLLSAEDRVHPDAPKSPT